MPNSSNQAGTLKALSLEPHSTPEARGKRLRRLRNIANLSRKQLADGCRINPNTVKGWEIAKYGGLTEKGANKVLKVLKNEGVTCNLNWLMHGIGVGPKISEKLEVNLDAQDVTNLEKEEEKGIIKELLFFRQQHKKCLDFIVSDDGMEPFFIEGEYVAGIPRQGDQLCELLGLFCIVQTASGNTLLRCIREGSSKGLYNLVCVNAQTTVTEVALYNVKLLSAAPVIWQRRKDPINKNNSSFSDNKI